jgi:F-type H+-transporting ATPase subunit b
MPQFNPEWYVSQIFWLIVTFVVLYLLMSRIALPRVAQILQERREKVSDDLAKAERLKSEAQEIYDSYESSLREAREQAQKVMREAREEIDQDHAKRHAEYTRELNQQIADAEGRIEAAKQEALQSLQSVAAEIAQAATGKLVGAQVEKERAEAAVRNVTEESR